MSKVNTRLDGARKAYREALEAARASPTSEAWAKLLAAGKDLSSAQEVRGGSRRSRRAATPTIHELEGTSQVEAQDLEQLE